MTSVLLVDDQALIRQAISVMLDATDDITIVGQGDTGLDAIAMARRLHPDVVLMDIRMPELDGIAATEKICGDPDLAATRVLILTTFENDTNIVAALRAGASGFIGKGSEPEELARAVRAVAHGDALLSPTATRSLITRCCNPPRPARSRMRTRSSLMPSRLGSGRCCGWSPRDCRIRRSRMS